MGDYPDIDGSTYIKNGLFHNDSIWHWTADWKWVPNFARMIQVAPNDTGLDQDPVATFAGNYYKVSLVVTRLAFAGPGAYLTFALGPDEGTHIIATGHYEWTIKSTHTGWSYPALMTLNTIVGDLCDVDYLSLIPLGDYAQAYLGIHTQTPYAREILTPDTTDHMINMASWKDKSSCLITWNDP